MREQALERGNRARQLEWCSAAKGACNISGIPYTWGHVAVQQFSAKQQFSLIDFYLTTLEINYADR
jgi:hypothetical protein